MPITAADVNDRLERHMDDFRKKCEHDDKARDIARRETVEMFRADRDETNAKLDKMATSIDRGFERVDEEFKTVHTRINTQGRRHYTFVISLATGGFIMAMAIIGYLLVNGTPWRISSMEEMSDGIPLVETFDRQNERRTR